jgi:hypothetical protein
MVHAFEIDADVVSFDLAIEWRRAINEYDGEAELG